MERYVDGFLLIVPKKNLEAYKKLAEDASKVWLEHGAVQYVETVGDDLAGMEGSLTFPMIMKPTEDEVIVFSWIVYNSKAHRDEVNEKVMKDERITGTMDKPMPFDVKRMAYGGFSTLVDK